MGWILYLYAMLFIVIVVLIICSWFIWDRRFKTKHGPNIPIGFTRTKEVSLDPTTKKKLVVYFNSETGERFYKEE
ncbi:hypothetical protein [Psychrobacillus vulpis]|uniref:Uncharacterized protein n=1 Tax=Psychrobacillus vulpis TaxID=2325572 RepID=A0A544TS91_9BACI|nr:hypothetical protein [Psychrobacillus vulpis]TQR20307.1 hypothetical protein FG384_07645 [Psychrobacillus vulpis]